MIQQPPEFKDIYKASEGLRCTMAPDTLETDIPGLQNPQTRATMTGDSGRSDRYREESDQHRGLYTNETIKARNGVSVRH